MTKIDQQYGKQHEYKVDCKTCMHEMNSTKSFSVVGYLSGQKACTESTVRNNALVFLLANTQLQNQTISS